MLAVVVTEIRPSAPKCTYEGYAVIGKSDSNDVFRSTIDQPHEILSITAPSYIAQQPRIFALTEPKELFQSDIRVLLGHIQSFERVNGMPISKKPFSV